MWRIKRAVRRLRRQFAPTAVILTYHRVADLAIDPHGIAVSPDRFAQQVEHIQRTCYPMHLLQLIRRIDRGESLPKRAVVLTFDDGYVDVLSQAYAVLTATQVPATVFVTSGYVGRERPLWSDELTQTLLVNDNLPDRLRLEVQGTEFEWPTTSLKERQEAHRAVYRLLKPLAPAVQIEKLAFLTSWASKERTVPVENRVLKPPELVHLSRDGLVEVGAHTVHHPTLSSLSADEQYQEITSSRQQLEAITGKPVLAFAYPYGGSQDFTDETVEIVEAAGFEAACTTAPGVVGTGSAPLRLPRCWVGNWDLAQFTKNLEWYFLL